MIIFFISLANVFVSLIRLWLVLGATAASGRSTDQTTGKRSTDQPPLNSCAYVRRFAENFNYCGLVRYNMEDEEFEGFMKTLILLVLVFGSLLFLTSLFGADPSFLATTI